MLLTQAECAQILKNVLNATHEQWHLLDYRLERDTTAVGYLGDYYTLTLSYCTVSDLINRNNCRDYCHSDFSLNLARLNELDY